MAGLGLGLGMPACTVFSAQRNAHQSCYVPQRPPYHVGRRHRRPAVMRASLLAAPCCTGRHCPGRCRTALHTPLPPSCPLPPFPTTPTQPNDPDHSPTPTPTPTPTAPPPTHPSSPTVAKASWRVYECGLHHVVPAPPTPHPEHPPTSSLLMGTLSCTMLPMVTSLVSRCLITSCGEGRGRGGGGDDDGDGHSDRGAVVVGEWAGRRKGVEPQGRDEIIPSRLG